jgi:Tol biopolymer transport system component
MSADGRFIAFESRATNLVPGDTNGLGDIFVRDMTGGHTTRVSLTATGTQATGCGDSEMPAISSDGRFVAFATCSANLVAGDTNVAEDVFLRDRTNATTTRVSVPDSGFQASSFSSQPAVSADAQFVVFLSNATNLVAGDTNGQPDIFVRDRTGQHTTRVSVPDSGFQATSGLSRFPAVSADSRFVAFDSSATNLVAGDTNGVADIFVRDRGAFGPKTLVTLSLASKRILARGPIRIRVNNRNHFAVDARLVAETIKRVSPGKHRVKLREKSFSVAGKTKKTVRLRLPAVLRHVLARRGRLALRLILKVRGPAGKTRTVNTKATLRLKL